uniref:GON-4-like protein n=1 Tax=Caenorhabditis tropicalis TaxID=1561998 RepID=A0A1I7TGM7_9PELO
MNQNNGLFPNLSGFAVQINQAPNPLMTSFQYLQMQNLWGQMATQGIQWDPHQKQTFLEQWSILQAMWNPMSFGQVPIQMPSSEPSTSTSSSPIEPVEDLPMEVDEKKDEEVPQIIEHPPPETQEPIPSVSTESPLDKSTLSIVSETSLDKPIQTDMEYDEGTDDVDDMFGFSLDEGRQSARRSASKQEELEPITFTPPGSPQMTFDEIFNFSPVKPAPQSLPKNSRPKKVPIYKQKAALLASEAEINKKKDPNYDVFEFCDDESLEEPKEPAPKKIETKYVPGVGFEVEGKMESQKPKVIPPVEIEVRKKEKPQISFSDQIRTLKDQRIACSFLKIEQSDSMDCSRDTRRATTEQPLLPKLVLKINGSAQDSLKRRLSGGKNNLSPAPKSLSFGPGVSAEDRDRFLMFGPADMSLPYTGWCEQIASQYFRISVKTLKKTHSEIKVELEIPLSELFNATSVEWFRHPGTVKEPKPASPPIQNLSNPRQHALKTLLDTCLNQIFTKTSQNDCAYIRSLSEVEKINKECKNRILNCLPIEKKFRKWIGIFSRLAIVDSTYNSLTKCQICKTGNSEKMIQLFERINCGLHVKDDLVVVDVISCGKCSKAIDFLHRIHHFQLHLLRQCENKIEELGTVDIDATANELISTVKDDKLWIQETIKDYCDLWDQTSRAERIRLTVSGKHWMKRSDRKMSTYYPNQPGDSSRKPETSRHFHVFVGDLSSEIDSTKLKEAFLPFGEVSEAKIIRDTTTNKAKGYGFVSYPRREDAERAIEQMNGQWLGRRTIRTNWATRKPEDEGGSPRRERGDGGSERHHPYEKSYEEVFNQSAPDNTSVYVGNIGTLIEEEIRNAFDKFGPIKEVKIFKPQGYAFVKFERKEPAARAIVQMNNTKIMVQMVRCSWGKSGNERSYSFLDSDGSSGQFHVFVGDLSSEIDSTKLKEAFLLFGEVSEAKIIRDTTTNKAKGYGFVSYPRKEEAERAIEEMNGQWLGRRTIRTNWATRKPEDEEGPPRRERGEEEGVESIDIAECLNIPHKLLTSHTVKKILERYLLQEVHELYEDVLSTPNFYVYDDGLEVVQHILNNSNHQLKMYGSAEELTENLKIFRDFPFAHEFFRSDFYYSTPVVYLSRKKKEYVSKLDLLVLLQNMATKILPGIEDGNEKRVNEIIMMTAHFKDRKSICQYVQCGGKMLKRLEQEMMDVVAKIPPIPQFSIDMLYGLWAQEVLAVRVFEDGTQQFVMQAELCNVLGDEFQKEDNIITTISMEEVERIYGHRVKNIEFLRTPIIRAKYRSVPVNLHAAEHFGILDIDSLNDLLRKMLIHQRIFCRSVKPETFNTLLDELMNNFFKVDSKPPNFLEYRTSENLVSVFDDMLEGLNYPFRDLGSGKTDKYSLDDLKKELNRSGLAEAFPEIVNRAQAVYSALIAPQNRNYLSTSDLFEAVFHSQLICIFESKLNKTSDDQKSSDQKSINSSDKTEEKTLKSSEQQKSLESSENKENKTISLEEFEEMKQKILELEEKNHQLNEQNMKLLQEVKELKLKKLSIDSENPSTNFSVISTETPRCEICDSELDTTGETKKCPMCHNIQSVPSNTSNTK